MLLGYDKDGEIKFIFTDEKYLEKKYPNNSAKISDFWGTAKHDLTEFFVSIHALKDWENLKHYKIIEGKVTKKNDEEIKNTRKSLKLEPGSLIIDDVKQNRDIAVAGVDNITLTRKNYDKINP